MASLEEANSVKPKKFSGHNFRLVSALEETQSNKDSSSKESSSKLTPELIEYHYHNRILSALYDVYHGTASTAKELWETLEVEYGIVDAGMDRFTVSSFNDYKVVNNKSAGEQIHEYQELLRVSYLIDKLPQSWNDFGRTLRHKQGELTLVRVINSIRIEEKHWSSQKKETENQTTVNLVENDTHKNGKNKNKFTINNKKNFKPRRTNFKFKSPNQNKNFHKTKDQGREKGVCFVCGRTNHKAKDFFYKKTKANKYKSNHNVQTPK
ncbi:unnamed protein product [Malus baccata var. baccata]